MVSSSITANIMSASVALAAAAIAVLPVQVCDAAVTTYTSGQTYVYGTFNAANPGNSTEVPSTAALAFAGITLNDITNHAFSGYVKTSDHPAFTLATKIAVHRDENGSADKIVAQFPNWDNGGAGNCHTKVPIIEFTNGSGGVYVCWLGGRYQSNSKDLYRSYFTMADDGTVSLNGGTKNGSYKLCALRVFPGFVQTAATPLWTSGDPAHPLTLGDLTNATFTARTGGRALLPSIEPIKAYNKCVATNAAGDVTSIFAEFQFPEDAWIKSVVAEFTEEGGAVYGTALRVCYVAGATYSPGEYRFRNEDGTYNGNNNSSVATSHDVGNYGVFDLVATIETPEIEYVLDADRNWSEFTGGTPLNDASLTVRVVVTGDSPTLTFDENVTIGKLIIANGLSDGIATNMLARSGAATVSFPLLELGERVYATVPAALSPATVRGRSGATAAYAGDETVSSAIIGAGGVEVASGRVTFSSSASSFTGGLKVKAGAVAVAGASWAQAPHQIQATGPFGLFGREKSFGKVFVEDGGMVDLNGQNYLAYVYTIAGNGVATGGVDAPGPLVNLGTALNIGTSATRPLVKSGWGIPWQANGLTLAGNVTLGATGCDLGIVSDNGSTSANGYFYGGTLNLGTNRLTKAGGGTLWLWTKSLSVSGSGLLDIVQGTVDIRQGAYTGSSSKISVGAGATLRMDAHVTANAITNNGTIEIVGTALTTNAANYFGDGAVVKNGSATAVVPFYNGSKSRYTVNGGTLMVQRKANVSGNPYAFVTEEEPAANQLVDVVAPGATFDFNGFYDVSASVRLAAGATVANTGKDLLGNQFQMVQLILAGDATAHAVGSFGLLAPGHKATRLELGGNTLTLTGTNFFWLSATTVLGTGTVAVSNGTLQAWNNTTGADWAIAVGTGGAFVANHTVDVKDFVNNGAAVGGTGTLRVTGTLTAGNAIPRLTLADGATVKLSATNAAQTVSTALTASGTITLDISAVSRSDMYAAGKVPVLAAPSIPSGVEWRIYDPNNCECGLRMITADGVSTLYVVPRTGLIISFR